MSGDSDSEKTEQPTDSKLKKAKEKGQIPRSKELSAVIMLFVGVGVLWMLGPTIGSNLTSLIQQGMLLPVHATDDKLMLLNLVSLLKMAFWIIFPLIMALIITALIAPLFIGGLLFSSKSLKPDFKRLNPISGLGRIFGTKIFSELLKGILKVILIFLITGWYLNTYFPSMLALPGMHLREAFSQAMSMIVYCGILAVLSLMPMVSFDIFYQIWSNLKKLKMSKQEIKDEYKEQEGDPQQKGRIRQAQQAIARRRMMGDVAKANVIVTNPTHYAVALEYDEKKMGAPKVLAKGADNIAQRIKELGKEHNIPQLEAPPLARALYRHSEVGEAIPTELYAAVAQVLAWVYQLKRWHRYGGAAPLKPHKLPVPESFDFQVNNGDKSSNE